MSPGGAERVKEDMRANGHSVWTNVLDTRRKATVDDVESQAWSSEVLESQQFDKELAPVSFQNVELPDGVYLGAFSVPRAGHDGRRVRAIEQLQYFLNGGNDTEGLNECDSPTYSENHEASSSHHGEVVQSSQLHLETGSSAQLEGTSNSVNVSSRHHLNNSPYRTLSFREISPSTPSEHQVGSRKYVTSFSGPPRNGQHSGKTEVSAKKRKLHENDTLAPSRDYSQPPASLGPDTSILRILTSSALERPPADRSDVGPRKLKESSREWDRDLHVDEDTQFNARANSPDPSDPLRSISNDVSPRIWSPFRSLGGGSQNSLSEGLYAQPRTRDRSSSTEGVSQGAIPATSLASVATSISPSNKLSRSISNFSFVSSATSTRLKPTKRSSDPVVLASQKRQRTRLKELLKKCSEAEIRIGIPSQFSCGSLAPSPFLPASSKDPGGTRGQNRDSIAMLPIDDESPGSTNVRRISENMEKLRNGEYLEIHCIDSQ